MSWIHAPPSAADSPRVLELLSEKEDLEQSFYRAEQSLKSLDGYLKSLTSLSTPSGNLMGAIAEYNAGAKVYQDEIRALRDKSKSLEKAIDEERLKLKGKARHPSLNMKASIGIFAEAAGEVELGLVYGAFRTHHGKSVSSSFHSCHRRDMGTQVWHPSWHPDEGKVGDTDLQRLAHPKLRRGQYLSASIQVV
jgi:hypothetical protein